MGDPNVQPIQYRSITNKEICCKREMRQIDKDTYVCDNCYGKITTKWWEYFLLFFKRTKEVRDSGIVTYYKHLFGKIFILDQRKIDVCSPTRR